MRRLGLYLFFFLVSLVGLTILNTKSIKAYDCQKQAWKSVYDVNTRETTVTTKAEVVYLNFGESYCDKDGNIYECQKGKIEMQVVSMCYSFNKCVENNNHAECVSPTNKCKVYGDGAGADYRDNLQLGCVSDSKLGICDGYTGKFIESSDSSMQCAAGYFCKNNTNSVFVNNASCEKAICVDAKNDIRANQGDTVCRNGKVQRCDKGGFTVTDSCKDNLGCDNAKDGPVCVKKNVFPCTKVDGKDAPKSATVGQDICSSDRTSIYRCDIAPDFIKIPCQSDEHCEEAVGKTPSVCIKNSAAVPPGVKTPDVINKQNQKGSSTLTMQLSENKGTVFCSSSGIPQKEPVVGNLRIYTALGCIPGDINAFIKWLLPLLFGIAGGVSFLLMVFGFIKVATSAGDPKEIEGAKETITSAIIGLVVSIFALFILKLILADILKIPGIS